jgi:hypothetical protein
MDMSRLLSVTGTTALAEHMVGCEPGEGNCFSAPVG